MREFLITGLAIFLFISDCSQDRDIRKLQDDIKFVKIENEMLLKAANTVLAEVQRIKNERPQ